MKKLLIALLIVASLLCSISYAEVNWTYYEGKIVKVGVLEEPLTVITYEVLVYDAMTWRNGTVLLCQNLETKKLTGINTEFIVSLEEVE